ncbi:MAG TPA: efflux RND transporter periplasmic adaptor subunit [Gemmatimonas aurantiaca]|nr:efflux RND transporter periplasmic adaptor subunit [Gemmatimonas aurantiaca]HCT59109.1 efflux RND transporter periplasmic adaptor subunit [Gemmatimonas aurantiaca]
MSAHSHSLRPTMYLPVAMLPLLPLFVACTDRGAAPAADSAAATTSSAIPVSVAPVRHASAAAPVTVTGTFGSRDEIPLAFKIGGVVARVLVDEGATVQRGQLLAALDLREIDAAVTKAQVAVDKAQRDHARLERLAADSVATLSQLQDVTSALDAARADLATARVNREYAIIVAPEAGIVLRRQGTPGSTVAAGQSVLSLGGSQRGRVLRAGLTDRDALRVRTGDKATVHFDAIPERTFTGNVVLLGRAADARTGTFTVEVSLSGAEALPNGLVGQLTVQVQPTRSADANTSATRHAIPVDALIEADRDSATVFTVSTAGEPIAQAVRVRVVQLQGDHATVDGLDAEARVITRGAPYVAHGARVRIITQATLDSASPAASATSRREKNNTAGSTP